MQALTLNMSALGHVTDRQLFEFCLANRDLRIERTSKGELVVMSPTFPPTGRRNSALTARLYLWNLSSGLGEVFDSNAGFTLPNGAMRSPDVSWISAERWNALPPEELETFSHICPDFVAELRSRSDRLTLLQEKMEEWMENGCRLGWLIDPEEEKVYLYRADGSRSTVSGFDNTLSGENVLPGFELALPELR